MPVCVVVHVTAGVSQIKLRYVSQIRTVVIGLRRVSAHRCLCTRVFLGHAMCTAASKPASCILQVESCLMHSHTHSHTHSHSQPHLLLCFPALPLSLQAMYAAKRELGLIHTHALNRTHTHLQTQFLSLQAMYAATRELGLGGEVKRRVMMGTYALSAGYYDAYYKRAQQVWLPRDLFFSMFFNRNYDAYYKRTQQVWLPCDLFQHIFFNKKGWESRHALMGMGKTTMRTANKSSRGGPCTCR